MSGNRNSGNCSIYLQLGKLALVLSAVLFTVSAQAFAQSENMFVNGGTLSWNVTSSGGSCGIGEYATTYTMSNFQFSYTYTSPAGTQISQNVPLSGSTQYIVSPGPPYCPPPGPQPSTGVPLLDNANFYRILFTATGPTSGTAFDGDLRRGQHSAEVILC